LRRAAENPYKKFGLWINVKLKETPSLKFSRLGDLYGI
jgi:hypothetical protein